MPTAPSHRRSRRGKGLAWVLAAIGAALVAGAAAAPHLTQNDPRSIGTRSGATSGVTSVVNRVTPTASAGDAARESPRTPPHVRRAENAGRPLRVDIPTLGVSTSVEPIAAVAGVLEPPADFRRVGWWKDGAVAGAGRGTTIITGHTVHTGGGVFNDLAKLRHGDPIRVTSPHGSIDYQVDSVTIYSKASLATYAQEVFSQAVPGRLALVTCEGWNGHGYNSNTVVVAIPTRAG